LNKLLSQPEIEVDEAIGLVHVKGQPVKLSAQEYKIMRNMAAKVDHLVTRNELMEAAWDTANGVSDQTIDAAVCRLRNKLKDQGHYIETVKGRGFILHRAVLLNSTMDNQIFT
jgi:two-component system OmpR family response regulator